MKWNEMKWSLLLPRWGNTVWTDDDNDNDDGDNNDNDDGDDNFRLHLAIQTAEPVKMMMTTMMTMVMVIIMILEFHRLTLEHSYLFVVLLDTF